MAADPERLHGAGGGAHPTRRRHPHAAGRRQPRHLRGEGSPGDAAWDRLQDVPPAERGGSLAAAGGHPRQADQVPRGGWQPQRERHALRRGGGHEDDHASPHPRRRRHQVPHARGLRHGGRRPHRGPRAGRPHGGAEGHPLRRCLPRARAAHPRKVAVQRALRRRPRRRLLRDGRVRAQCGDRGHGASLLPRRARAAAAAVAGGDGGALRAPPPRRHQPARLHRYAQPPGAHLARCGHLWPLPWAEACARAREDYQGGPGDAAVPAATAGPGAEP
mmetsp:Transcript_29724/g.95552  ORF Transcript_29724/g.95552 Transcript_29724/m.95552 type:complete len:275 (-) Transcript_29724:832-1656(-)